MFFSAEGKQSVQFNRSNVKLNLYKWGGRETVIWVSSEGVMRHLKLHSNLTVLIVSKECPQTTETQLDMNFITIDVGFNLLCVYVYNGGSQTAIQDCPLTVCSAFGYGVCEGELSGNEGV